jgi:hypothetical protein
LISRLNKKVALPTLLAPNFNAATREQTAEVTAVLTTVQITKDTIFGCEFVGAI